LFGRRNIFSLKDHMYFYQVQMQMKLCKVKFCDFVVWGKDGAYLTQRIECDEDFTENALVKVKSFVKSIARTGKSMFYHWYEEI